jgi:PAS domain S-box-containing protein
MTDSPEFNASLREVFSSGQATPSFHERVLDRLRDGVYFVDRERRILYWNKGAELLTGYSSGEVVGKYCFDNILAHVNGAGCDICLSGCPLAITIHDGECREVEVYLRHKLGHRIPVSIRSAPLMDDGGRIIGAVEVFSDATTKRNIERRVGQLESVAFLDPLTGVPNRRYIELKITQAIQDVQQFGRRAGLMMIDVDHFKHVNDKYGHPIGDAVLCALCNTIMPNLRLGDVLGRWGVSVDSLPS